MLIRLIAAAAVLASLSVTSLACACCVDPGYYSLSTSKVDGYILGELEYLKFDKAANIYMSEAGFDGTRGLEDLAADEAAGRPIDMGIVETFLDRKWRFDITTAGGRASSLVLPMPTSMVRFKVDLHDNEPGTETGLYKEFRFKGTLGSASGFLRKSAARPATYFLVFQGRGNGCDSSADFTHWRLEIEGPRADYALWGKIVQP